MESGTNSVSLLTIQYYLLSLTLRHACRFGAVNRIRTGDLVLTKDVLCHLSHNSMLTFLILNAKILYTLTPVFVNL